MSSGNGDELRELSGAARDAPPAPSTLQPDSFAARLYGMLAPLAEQDPAAGWSLLILCNAIGSAYQLVEDLVRDTADGPGWSALMDLDRCPDEALPWLAQFVGIRLLPGSTPDEQRARIASTAGFRRGTRDSLVGAASATLTGGAHVYFRERTGNPTDKPAYAYYLEVTTYTSETPNPAATLAALIAQKPGGLVLTHFVSPGQTWQQVKASGQTWAQVKTGYINWDSVRSAKP